MRTTFLILTALSLVACGPGKVEEVGGWRVEMSSSKGFSDPEYADKIVDELNSRLDEWEIDGTSCELVDSKIRVEFPEVEREFEEYFPELTELKSYYFFEVVNKHQVDWETINTYTRRAIGGKLTRMFETLYSGDGYENRNIAIADTAKLIKAIRLAKEANYFPKEYELAFKGMEGDRFLGQSFIEWEIVVPKDDLSSCSVVEAKRSFDHASEEPIVYLQFDEVSAEKWRKLTLKQAAYQGRIALCSLEDGVYHYYFSPTVQVEIPDGQAVISGVDDNFIKGILKSFEQACELQDLSISSKEFFEAK